MNPCDHTTDRLIGEKQRNIVLQVGRVAHPIYCFY